MKWLLEHTLLRFGLSQPFLLLGVVGMMVVAAFLALSADGQGLPARVPGGDRARRHHRRAGHFARGDEQDLRRASSSSSSASPKCERSGRRLGRAERGDHVVPVSHRGVRRGFPRPKRASPQRSRAEILADVRKKVQSVPGTFSVVMGPLADRIGHMLSGVSAPVAVKIFGPDLDKLRQLGIEVQARRENASPASRTPSSISNPSSRSSASRRTATARAAYGITPGKLNEQLSTLLGGENVAELREGQRDRRSRHPPARWSGARSPEKLAELPIEVTTAKAACSASRSRSSPTCARRRDRTSSSAKTASAASPSPSSRRCAMSSTLVVRAAKAKSREKVKLPEGYFITLRGRIPGAEAKPRSASPSLSAVVFVVIAFLLYGYFRTPFFAFQVLCDIPLALVGGLVFT